MQDQADLKPEPIERLQQARPHDGDQEEERRERKRPQARTATIHQRPKCDDRPDGGKNEAKGAVRGICLISPGSQLSPVAVMHGLYLILQLQGNLLAAEAQAPPRLVKSHKNDTIDAAAIAEAV
jgi:hypothetical protein